MRRLLALGALSLVLAACGPETAATPAPAASSPTTPAPTQTSDSVAPSPSEAILATPAPPDSLTFAPGDDGLVNFNGGTYGVGWTGCDWVEIAPTDGSAPIVLLEQFGTPADGEAGPTIPAGPAYVNRSGVDCVVTLTR